MEKYDIIAIMGQAGAGKDSFLNTLANKDYLPQFSPIISCTTRPKRDYEKDGVDYHFLTNEEFAEQVLNGEMLEATVFNNWCYGTSIKSLTKNKINIGVFNPEGVEILRDNQNINLTVIYIIADDKTRLLRQLNREENPDCKEIVRRYGTDKNDFNDARIKNIHPDFVIENGKNQDIEALAIKFVFDNYNILGKFL